MPTPKQPPPQDDHPISTPSVLNTPIGPIQSEHLTRMVERIGVLALLGWVLHLVLNGQTLAVATNLNNINSELKAMNSHFANYLATQTRNDLERSRLP